MFGDAIWSVTFTFWKFYVWCSIRCVQLRTVTLRHVTLTLGCATLCSNISLVVRASDCQCTSCNGPGFDPSIRRHSGIWGAADEAVLSIVRTKRKKSPPKIKKNKKNLSILYLGACHSYSSGYASWHKTGWPYIAKMFIKILVSVGENFKIQIRICLTKSFNN